MQHIGEIFGIAQFDLAGAVLVLGLVTLAVLTRLDHAQAPYAPAESVRAAEDAVVSVHGQAEPDDEWERVTGRAYVHLTHAGDLPALQARAALQVDAAEHALARMLADCARVGCHFVRQEPETVLHLVPQTPRPGAPRTLAA